jgi:hypothetical protein
MIGSDFCFTRSKATHSPISQLADESSYVTGAEIVVDGALIAG